MTVWRTADPSARLTDAAEARPPRDATFADAAGETNFVVFEPGWVPDDCRVTDVTLRPEQPPGRPEGIEAADIGQTPWSEGNPCAIRAHVVGDGRRLRLKEFLYDWAPPSASVAPLWRTPEPTPFECGGAVGWLGIDYKGNRGACVQRARTQIEVSVTDGQFDDGELEALLNGATPVPGLEAPIRRVPFHTLNYWQRYQCAPPGVPHGLWSHSPARPYQASQPLGAFGLRDHPITPLLPPRDRYVLDSAAGFPQDGAIEAVFRSRENGSDHLWLTAALEGSPLAPDLPPEPSDQPAEVRREIELRARTVHYAALTGEHGAWEAFWEEDDVRYAAWASASQSLDREGFRGLVDSLSAQ